MNRGARRDPTFRDPDHCGLFLDRLAEVVRRFGLEVHAYVLMPNHFHLLVRSVQGNLSVCMKELLGPYTQTLNHKYGWDGPVFRGRFKNQLVSESEHLQILVPYIHLNPVRARLVAAPEFAMWSSYTDYVGLSENPVWLTTDVVMSIFETVDALVDETRAYQRGELAWPLDFDLRRGIFKTWSPEIPRTVREREAWKAHQIAFVQRVFCIASGLPWTEVLTAKRGRKGNPARRLAVWLFLRETDLEHRSIGAAVGATRNQVCVMIHRLRRSSFEEPLGAWMKRAEIWMSDNVPEDDEGG